MSEPDPRAPDLLRSRRWRVAVAVALAAVAGAVAFVALGTREVEVVLRVEGEGCSRKPRVAVSGGGEELEIVERHEVALPWERRYQLHPGDEVNLTASGDSGCRITCAVAVGGSERVRRQDVGEVDCQARVE